MATRTSVMPGQMAPEHNQVSPEKNGPGHRSVQQQILIPDIFK